MVKGGMHRIAQTLAGLGARLGVTLRYGVEAEEIELQGGRVGAVRLAGGERLETDAVVFNGDVSALAGGLLGRAAAGAAPAVARHQRSLSAVTWNLHVPTRGFPLLRHTVFFSRDYAAEFNDIFRRARLPREPTVYICAQDRADRDGPVPEGPERLLCLVNAPATGDFNLFDASEIEQCEQRTFALLERCGLHVPRRPQAIVVTTPAEFERLFPATGGALYGRASHGWMASFRRPGSRSRIPGLYLAGGSIHPGPGVPMAALSGQLAATSLIEDLASTSLWLPAATPGGTSMR
jgi:1-hydroxycarotenoid 3,4-desaturase